MKVITDYPVAYESKDHTEPWGTKGDNNTSLPYIEEIEKHFEGRKINFLDIGCSGGQHRSVFVAEQLYKPLLDIKDNVKILHTNLQS